MCEKNVPNDAKHTHTHCYFPLLSLLPIEVICKIIQGPGHAIDKYSMMVPSGLYGANKQVTIKAYTKTHPNLCAVIWMVTPLPAIIYKIIPLYSVCL